MIEVKIPKEIRTYQETLFFGLNLRQTICAVLAIIVNVPLFWILNKAIGSDLAGWIIIAAAAPFILVGFIKVNGMPFEYAAICAVRLWLQPQECPYITENIFEQSWNQEDEERYASKKRRKTKTAKRK